MGGLSGALSNCNAGCYINNYDQSFIVLYVDDISVMAPPTIVQQKCYKMYVMNMVSQMI